MKNISVVFVLAFILLGFNINSASASGTYNDYILGCSSTMGYSPITGQKCAIAVYESLPVGCTSTQGYSPLTGVKCDTVQNSSLPAGCTSTAGYSPTTGVKCDSTAKPVTIALPEGCASSSGYSVTTGLPCGGTSQPTPVSPAFNLISVNNNANNPNSYDYIATALGGAMFDGVVFRADCNDDEVGINIEGGVLLCGQNKSVSYGLSTQYSYPVTWSSKDGKNHLVGVTATAYIGDSIVGTDRDVNTITSAVISPLIIVLSPNGGENFTNGKSYPIQWETKNLPANSKVMLVFRGWSYPLPTETIAIVDASDKSYSWTVPSSLPSGLYSIAIYHIGPSGSASAGLTKAQSNNPFAVSSAVVQPSITVLSPNGGESFVQENVLTGSFTTSNIAQGTFCEVAIVGRKSGGSPVDTTIATLNTIATEEQVYSGTIPANFVPPGSYRIRVDCGGGVLIAQDQSDNSFAIVAPVTPIDTESASISAFLENTFEDRAGIWENFGPGPGSGNRTTADWNLTATLKVSTLKEVKSVSLTHKNGYEGWATSRDSIYGTQPYPLVVVLKDTNSQLNKSYDQKLVFDQGIHALKLYAQMESSIFSGAKLVVTFTDGTTVNADVPAASFIPPTS